MIVVSDATAINHLGRAGLIFILPEMLGTVIVPSAVYAELQARETPPVVRAIVDALPDWLQVRNASLIVDAELDQLDRGEREAIILVEELKAELLLMDEKKGRRIATERKITVIGTLGLLERAALLGMVDFRNALNALRGTDFYFSRDLEADFLKRFPGGEDE